MCRVLSTSHILAEIGQTYLPPSRNITMPQISGEAQALRNIHTKVESIADTYACESPSEGEDLEDLLSIQDIQDIQDVTYNPPTVQGSKSNYELV